MQFPTDDGAEFEWREGAFGISLVSLFLLCFLLSRPSRKLKKRKKKSTVTNGMHREGEMCVLELSFGTCVDL